MEAPNSSPTTQILFFLNTIPPSAIPASVETILLLLLKPCIFTPSQLILRIVFSQSHIPPFPWISFSLSPNFSCVAYSHVEVALILIQHALYLLSFEFFKRMSALTVSTFSQPFTLHPQQSGIYLHHRRSTDVLLLKMINPLLVCSVLMSVDLFETYDTADHCSL